MDLNWTSQQNLVYTKFNNNNWVFPKCFHSIRWIQWQKYYFKKTAVLKPIISCVRNRLYRCATETQLTEKTVQLILIHASVISQIPWIRWIEWNFCSI